LKKCLALKLIFIRVRFIVLAMLTIIKRLMLRFLHAQLKNLPICYLGVPIDHKTLSKTQWANTEEKFEKKLGVWQGRYLSLGGKIDSN
jgi:hypothetical protein